MAAVAIEVLLPHDTLATIEDMGLRWTALFNRHWHMRAIYTPNPISEGIAAELTERIEQCRIG